jgi:hypothetical protein
MRWGLPLDSFIMGRRNTARQPLSHMFTNASKLPHPSQRDRRHLRHHGIAQSLQAVHPAGKPIISSTKAGFRYMASPVWVEPVAWWISRPSKPFASTF